MISLPQADLDGIVIATDPPFDEPPDPNLGRTLLLFLYAMPLFALIPFALFLIIIFIVPLRILGVRGFSVMSLMALTSVLSRRGGGGARVLPVRNFRIRDSAGSEHQVRIKGHLTGGTVDRGDTVLVWGHRHGGVLQLRRGTNLRTKSDIRLKSTLPIYVVLPATIAWLAILLAALIGSK